MELESKTGETLRSPPVPPTLQRLAAQAAHDPHRVFTTLASLIDTDFLREAYHHTSESSAAGSDGVTAQQEAAHLDEHVRDLHERLRRGRSQAAPVERVWMEPDDGGQRPLGQPTCEDTMVQRAVALRREASDAHAFYDGSSGLRPGRSPHDARQECRERCRHEGSGGIVEAEVRGYCESIDRTRRREALRPRVKDGRIGRLMGKGRRAGVREEGGRKHPATGVVHGGPLAPVLAKRLLHQVLEAGGEHEGQARRQGRRFLSRFAEACVLGGALEADARRLRAVLPKRFARYGVPIPPTQTALMAFGKPAGRPGAEPRHGTGDFRGLTPDWTPARRGGGVSTRRTARKRRRRPKQSLWRWCRAHRHRPLKHPYPMLCLKLRGHLRYDGLQGNGRVLEEVRRSAKKAWRSGLRRRRSPRAIGWEKCQQRRETSVLPTPGIVHNI